MSPAVVDETKVVTKAMKRAAIRSLAQAGAYVRGIAQRMITKKDGPPKPPGSPPRSPTGRLRGNIAFNVDKAADNVVIGPTFSAIGLIGHTHEFGGVEEPRKTRRKVRFDLRVGGFGPIARPTGTGGFKMKIGEREFVFVRFRTEAQVRHAKRVLAAAGISEKAPEFTAEKPRRHYPARPFMGPSLERSRERLPEFWHNVLKRN